MSPKHSLEVLRRDDLVVVGAVVAGRGVALTADVLGQAVDHVIGHVLGLAAENMLEQVRKARAALRIVLGTDVVPHRRHHVRGGRIGDGDHREAVVELPLGELNGRRGYERDRGVLGDGRLAERHSGEGTAGDEELTKHKASGARISVSFVTTEARRIGASRPRSTNRRFASASERSAGPRGCDRSRSLANPMGCNRPRSAQPVALAEK